MSRIVEGHRMEPVHLRLAPTHLQSVALESIAWVSFGCSCFVFWETCAKQMCFDPKSILSVDYGLGAMLGSGNPEVRLQGALSRGSQQSKSPVGTLPREGLFVYF